MSTIVALAEQCHQTHKVSRSIALLYATFGDESHDETNARVFAVAALFGSEDEWSHVKQAWLERTSGKVFHASECETSRGSYAAISNDENKRLYKDLTRILCNSRLLGYGCAIDLAGHKRYFANAPDDVPYYQCFLRVVSKCGEWAKLAIPQGINRLTFDQRQESNYNAGVLYSMLVNSEDWDSREYLGDEIVFGTRKMAEIQAADLFAREIMKHFDNIIGPVKRPTRGSMSALLETRRFFADMLHEGYFEEKRLHFESLCKESGICREEYGEWLVKRKLSDTISSRHKFMAAPDGFLKSGHIR